MKRLRVKPVLVALVMLATAAVALAYWTTTGTGSGEAGVGNVTSPNLSVPGTSSGSHALAWSAATTGDATQDSQTTYTVERKLEVGGTWAPVPPPSSCSGTLTSTTLGCTDTVTASGNYFYRVVAEFRSWTATSNEAGPVMTTVGPSDTTAPYVDSIDRADPSPTSDDTVRWTVTFSEAVSGVDATDFGLVEGSAVTGSSITDVSPATGPDDTYTVTADTGNGSGTLRLDLDDDNSIEDGAGNDLVAAPPASDPNGDFTGEQYTIDKTAPQVASIVRNDPTSSLTNASVVKWTVTFTESVSGVDAGDFALAHGTGLSGSTLAGVVEETGSTYTVTANTGSGDGTLNLNVVDNDTIEDGVGNLLGGGFTGGAASEYHVDRIGPAVQSISRTNPTAAKTSAATVKWTVTFDDSSVEGVDEGDISDPGGFTPADFALVSSGLTSPSITSVHATAGGVYEVTATTGSGDGTLQLDVVDNDTIMDQLGNKLGGEGTGPPPGNGDGSFQGVAGAYTIDKTPPIMQSINRADGNPTNDATVTWTVTFSEDVSTVVTADFAVAASGGVTGASVTGVTGSGSTYTVTANTGTGDGTLGLNLNDTNNSITDTAGNAIVANTFTGQLYTIDKTAPSVLDPTTTGFQSFQSNGTTAGNGIFQNGDYLKITFDEDMSGVAATGVAVSITRSNAQPIVHLAIEGITTGSSTGSTAYINQTSGGRTASATGAITLESSGSLTNNVVVFQVGTNPAGNGTPAAGQGVLTLVSNGGITDAAGNVPNTASSGSLFRLF